MKKFLAFLLIFPFVMALSAFSEDAAPGPILSHVLSKGYYVTSHNATTDVESCLLIEGDDYQYIAFFENGQNHDISIKIDEYFTNYRDGRALFFDLVGMRQWPLAYFKHEESRTDDTLVVFDTYGNFKTGLMFDDYQAFTDAVQHALESTPAPTEVIRQSDSYKRMKEAVEGAYEDD